MFRIYLFHENNIILSIIYKGLLIDHVKFNDYNVFINVLFGTIFIVGIIIESVRKLIIWIILKIRPT
jgi:hypothetical protein